MKECFEPVLCGDAKILILGSFPGELSLEKQQYYAHPRNCFWFIMAEILGFDATLEYPARIDKLTENRIALWDVLQCCRRNGSLDSAIEKGSIVVNDFEYLFQRCSELSAIFFNGRRAEAEFKKHVLSLLDARLDECELICLPSTSPALASLSFQQKLSAWLMVRDKLQSPESRVGSQ